MMLSRNSQYVLFALLLILLVAFTYLLNPILSFYLLLGLIFVAGIVTILYPPAFWMLIVFVYIIFESEQYRLGIFPLPLLQYPLIAGLNIVLLAITVYSLLISKRENIEFDLSDKLIMYFLLGAVACAGIGLMHGYPIKAVVKEIGLLSGYFAFITMKRADKNVIKVMNIVFAIALIVVLGEYLYLAKIVIASPFLLTVRVVTRQATLALPAIPIGFSFLMWSRDIKKKIIGVLLLMLFTPIIILSMQRTLWLAVFTGILISIVVGFFSSKNNRRKALSLLLTSLLIVAFIVTAGLLIANIYFSDNYLNLLNARMTSLQTVNNMVQDKSYQVRTGDTEKAIEKLQNYPYAFFIGRGLGDRILRIFPFSEFISYIDNTYLVILWKMGIVMLGLFLFIFFYNIRYFFRIMLERENNALAIGIIGFLFSVLIFMVGTNLGLVYRFITVFWGIVGVGYAYYKKSISNA